MSIGIPMKHIRNKSWSTSTLRMCYISLSMLTKSGSKLPKIRRRKRFCFYELSNVISLRLISSISEEEKLFHIYFFLSLFEQATFFLLQFPYGKRVKLRFIILSNRKGTRNSNHIYIR